jgi:hypothetical protein
LPDIDEKIIHMLKESKIISSIETRDYKVNERVQKIKVLKSELDCTSHTIKSMNKILRQSLKPVELLQLDLEISKKDHEYRVLYGKIAIELRDLNLDLTDLSRVELNKVDPDKKMTWNECHYNVRIKYYQALSQHDISDIKLIDDLTIALDKIDKLKKTFLDEHFKKNL